MTKGDRKELAQNRTDLAEDRTVLSEERSFASWLRTGLGSVGVGLGFGALFRMLEPDWIAKAIASIFLLVAIYMFVSAAQRARERLSEIDQHDMVSRRKVRFRILAWSLATGTAALCATIWLLA